MWTLYIGLVFVGFFIGMVLMALLSINNMTRRDNREAKKLATQAKLIGALYSLRLYGMADDVIHDRPIKDEIQCPACYASYDDCKCGLIKR